MVGLLMYWPDKLRSVAVFILPFFTFRCLQSNGIFYPTGQIVIPHNNRDISQLLTNDITSEYFWGKPQL